MARLSNKSFRTLQEIAQRHRATNFGDREVVSPPPRLTETAWVKLTSTTLSAGRYPARRWYWDEETSAMVDTSEVVWADTPNGETLASTTTYYAAQFTGIPAADGKAVYQVMGQFQGTVSPLTTKGDLWGFSTVDARLPVGTNGQYLSADSTESLGVKWVGITAITSLGGLTGATQTFATGTTGTDFNIASSGTTHTFHMPDAGATQRGVVTTGTQTFAGDKTFSSTNGVKFGNTGSDFMTVSQAGIDKINTGNNDLVQLSFSFSNYAVMLYVEDGGTQKDACYAVYDASSGPFLGKYGSFTTTDGKTITVKGGIITNIV